MLSITSFPAFILLAFAAGCKSHASSFQVMLSAKLSQVVHFILDTIRASNDIVSYLRWHMSKCCKALLLSGLGAAFRTFMRLCHIALCFFCMLVAHQSAAVVLNGFRRFFDTMSLRVYSAKLSRDRKSTRLNSSHQIISYAVFCLKKKTY